MRVAVFGAGISGLTLAAALRQFARDVDVDVYERDNALDSRFQGYSLGIKGDTGILALRRLGLFEHLRPSMTPITNFVFVNQRGQRLLELASRGEDDKYLTLRVRRNRLKEELRAGASGVQVTFGAECAGYEHTSDRVEVQLRGGQTVQANYVVAADGVGSALRQQMIGDSKRYVGLTAIVGEAPLALKHPLLEGG